MIIIPFKNVALILLECPRVIQPMIHDPDGDADIQDEDLIEHLINEVLHEMM